LTAIELTLRSDWSRGKLLRWMLAAFAVLTLVAVRHRWFWGGEWVNYFEALGLLLFLLLAGTALAQGLRQASNLPRSFLLGVGIVATLAAVATPPFLSSDLFDYLSRGRLEHMGLNPYLHDVSEVATDPRMAPFAALSEWTHWRMPYGPLMGCVQYLLGFCPVPWLGVYVWKLLAGAAHVTAGWLFYRTLAVTADERTARRGLVLWLWNPLLLLEGVVSAHNDIVVALLLVAMALWIVRDRFVLATVAFGAAVLFKHGVAPIGPLLLALAWRQKRLRDFGLGVAITAVVTALLWWRYFTEPGALDFVLRQTEVARASLYSLVGAAAGPTAARAVVWCGGALALLCLLFGLRRLRDARGFGGYALLTLAVFLLLSAPQFAPWYHLWWLPLVALAPVPVALRVFEFTAWVGPLSYLVWTGTHTFGVAHQVWQFALAALWPLSLLLLEWRNVLGLPPRAHVSDLP